MAAVVALNAPLGERGGNALRLLQGVVIGILAGELALGILARPRPAVPRDPGRHGGIVRALGGTPVALAQGATAAILTVVFGGDRSDPTG